MNRLTVYSQEDLDALTIAEPTEIELKLAKGSIISLRHKANVKRYILTSKATYYLYDNVVADVMAHDCSIHAFDNSRANIYGKNAIVDVCNYACVDIFTPAYLWACDNSISFLRDKQLSVYLCDQATVYAYTPEALQDIGTNSNHVSVVKMYD